FSELPRGAFQARNPTSEHRSSCRHSGTVLARCLVFPLIVKSQRQAVLLNNHYPQMSEMNSRITDARKSGNRKEFMKAYTELNQYQKQHNLNPRAGFLAPLVQFGAETGVSNPSYHVMKTVFRVMPVLLLPITINFPTVRKEEPFPPSLHRTKGHGLLAGATNSSALAGFETRTFSGHRFICVCHGEMLGWCSMS
ncbi:hypothetical protein Chor_009641, partial [Crotalus horridus]